MWPHRGVRAQVWSRRTAGEAGACGAAHGGGPAAGDQNGNSRGRWTDGVELGKGGDFREGRAGLQCASFPPGSPREAFPGHHHPQETANQADQLEHAEMRLYDGHLLVCVLQQRRLGKKELLPKGAGRREGGGQTERRKGVEGAKGLPSKWRGRREDPPV